MYYLIIQSQLWFDRCNSWPGRSHQRNYFLLPNAVPASSIFVLRAAVPFSDTPNQDWHDRCRSETFRDSFEPIGSLHLCTLRRLCNRQAKMMNENVLKISKLMPGWSLHSCTPPPNCSTGRSHVNHLCHEFACTHCTRYSDEFVLRRNFVSGARICRNWNANLTWLRVTQSQ